MSNTRVLNLSITNIDIEDKDIFMDEVIKCLEVYIQRCRNNISAKSAYETFSVDNNTLLISAVSIPNA